MVRNKTGTEHEVEGKAKQAKGAVKDAYGKATKNRRQRFEGKMDKAKGKAQEAWGETKQKVERPRH